MNEGLVAAIQTRIATGLPVRRTLPVGGRLHVDRPLPFLCVYRRPHDDTPDLGTADLVKTQASYLVSPQPPYDVAPLVAATSGALTKAVGVCLVLELWASDEPDAVITSSPSHPSVAATLRDALDAVVDGPVTLIDAPSPPAPPHHAPLAGFVIGLRLRPCWRTSGARPGKGEAGSGAFYPFVLRTFAAELAHALQKTFFELARVATPRPLAHFHMFGRRRMVMAVRDADRALAESARSFDFLLDVSPVHADEAWHEFDTTTAPSPSLRYRPLAVDPELTKRRLYDLPLERVEDPVLAQLLRDKRRELDRQLSLLEDRGTPRFLPGSIQLYGGVDDALFAEASAILDALGPAPHEGPMIDAPTMASFAEAELAMYRRQLPSLSSRIYLRGDVLALIVSHGDLLVPQRATFPSDRVAALLAHEIGTHVVTHANGNAQPLQVMGTGLAGYEALQEGLALFAEYLVGGLDATRLRLIAARVVAVRALVAGATFRETHTTLTEHGLSRRAAFGVTLRVYRGGGFTKDAIYLRGLLQLLDYLQAGGALEPLLIGKIALEQVPLIEELLHREVLLPAQLTPSWLSKPAAVPLITRARQGLRPLDLVTPTHTQRAP